MNFVDIINSHGRTMHKDSPPVLVAHPVYGELGRCDYKGFHPKRGRWASTRAILRDSSRTTVKLLRKFEDYAPSFAIAGIVALLAKDPFAMPYVIGTISTYDNIVTARGSGAMQDVWMNMTATQSSSKYLKC